jgi:hypothetical protein
MGLALGLVVNSANGCSTNVMCAVVKIVESADTSPGTQNHILEVLNLNVAIVIIPGRQESEF